MQIILSIQNYEQDVIDYSINKSSIERSTIIHGVFRLSFLYKDIHKYQIMISNIEFKFIQKSVAGCHR